MEKMPETMGKNIKQGLIEVMADFLDSDTVKNEEGFYLMADPIEREKSELHIRMAIAAMREYKKTIKPM